MPKAVKNIFSQTLLEWYDQYGRKDLPWQQQRNAYRVWISEIMLQQTQVKTVIPYFEAFMQRFPTLLVLADAPQDEVLHYWSGLGYYARARNLHCAAQCIRDEHKGEFPLGFEQVLALPGIGRSTAGAILAQAAGQRHAILDGNVKRVLARYHGVQGWTGQAKVQALLWELAEQHTPQQRLADYTQAIMDLGATVCRRGRPDCGQCPVSINCVALASGRVLDLPTPKPKKTLPVKSVRMLLMQNPQGQVLLEKRPPSGIWGGLWSLPEMPLEHDAQLSLDEAVSDWCGQHYQQQARAICEQAVVRHTFSHYHLDITPCVVRVNNPDQCVMEAEGRVWYKACQEDRNSPLQSGGGVPQNQNQNLGLAAPVSNLLNRLNEELP